MRSYTGCLRRTWLAGLILASQSALADCGATPDLSQASCLRQVYSQPAETWPAPHVDPGIDWQELAALPERNDPAYLASFDPTRARLGEQLFFDPKLSRSGQIACASCHEPDLAFADGRRVSFGHDRKAGIRNAPSVVMSSMASSLFWDGRASSLEQQALMPIVDPVEMAFDIDELVQRLRADADYPARFAQAFSQTPLDAGQIALALADYQRTLLPRNSRLDRFLGGQSRALSDEQLQGLHLFRTKARCLNCHQGAALSDNRFHNLGLSFYGRNKHEDLGRYRITGKPEDVGAFRTPSLRQVARTGPWMHNGLFPSLDGLLMMYNAGMPRPRPNQQQLDDPLFPQTSDILQPLGLDAQELKALRSFLETL